MDAAPLCLRGDVIAPRVLSAMDASRNVSGLTLSGSAWSGEVGAGGQSRRERWGGGIAMRPCLAPLAEDRAPHCESAPARRKKTCSVFFPVHRKTFDPGSSDSFLPPIHPQGAGPLAMPTPPHRPTRSSRAMARRQTRAPFFKVVRLHLINSQARPDWLRPEAARPPLAPQIQSELCAVCPREANPRGPRRLGISGDKMPASQHGDCAAPGSP